MGGVVDMAEFSDLCWSLDWPFEEFICLEVIWSSLDPVKGQTL